MTGKIVPKKLAKGVDICATDKYFYIIRSDLNCYMKSTSFHSGEDLSIFKLHPACRDGDHYLGHKADLFYIIKGNSYRRVSNMNTDGDAVVYTLHPKCQGGDHYLSAYDNFYIIYQSRGVYRKTKNMHEDTDSVEYPLHAKCKDGLYYFGTTLYYYFLKPQDEWGFQYLRSTDFSKNENSESFSFHPSVISFLPGGLSITKGPAFGNWVCIKTISNDSDSPVQWEKKITKTIGYEKEKMSSLEHNWNVSATVSVESGALTAAIAKTQFSMTAEYGGSSVNTDRESWNEATQVEETVTITLQPKHKIYIWTYQLGLGKEPVLHCRDMRILNTSTPPTDNPLPPAAK
ncbi:uncharacterized protein [Dendropsophus ebraccatus]|uniref:uncharacterized protein n=1 Tax=Dendropsophus ebraccatus TaxID=150705 RepID=UPI0038320F67